MNLDDSTEEQVKALGPEKVWELYTEYQKELVAKKNLEQQTQQLQSQAQLLQDEATRWRTEESRRRLRVESPPTFHGNRTGPKVGLWLFHLRQYFETLNMQENVTVAYAATLLRENAMVWWRSHVEQADRKLVERISTWQAFCAAIQAEFQPINTVKIARDRLAELRQRNSVQAYAYEFRNIVADIPGMTEDEKVDKFVRGLKDRTRQEVDIRDPRTLDEAVRIADRYDSISFQAHKKATSKAVVQRTGPTPMELDAVRMQEYQRANLNTETSVNRPRNRIARSTDASFSARNSNDENGSRNSCFKCGRVGHFKKQCPLYRRMVAKVSSQ